MNGYNEIQKLVLKKYHELRASNPNELDGNKLLYFAKKYVQADLLADWLMFQQNHNLGVNK